MSIELKMRAESDFLRVDVRGEFSLAEAERSFLEILEAVAKHKVQKVYTDGRELRGEPEAIERFYIGKFAAESVAEFAGRGAVSRFTQFAFVLKEPVLDPHRFGETVAVNRGMVVKMFDNPEEAFEWLGVPPDQKPEAADGK